MSPAPTRVTGAVCAAPGTAISTAAVHDSSIATDIEASSSSVVFFILLPLHKGGTPQPRTVVQRDHASNHRHQAYHSIAVFIAAFFANFRELRKAEVRRI